MIVSFPDNATIQIFVVPPGTAPLIAGHGSSGLVLPAAAAATPKRSRRRNVLFLGAGVVLCIGVLMVVQGQQSVGGRGIEPTHAARLTAALPQPSDDAAHMVHPAPITHTIPSAPVSSADADPSATVRRLLAVPPTVTPPPGTGAAVPSPGAAGVPADVDKRNSFGMRD